MVYQAISQRVTQACVVLTALTIIQNVCSASGNDSRGGTEAKMRRHQRCIAQLARDDNGKSLYPLEDKKFKKNQNAMERLF